MKKLNIILLIIGLLFGLSEFSFTQKVKIGELSPQTKNGELQLRLNYRNQGYNQFPKHPRDIYEPAIHSPKSAKYSLDGKKYYIESLEGFKTVVFDSKTHQKIKVIHHDFNESNQHLFKDGEYTLFDYEFPTRFVEKANIFQGKPVESALSADGKWLFVSYYRRSYDPNAQLPSALCVIDTEKDEIVRVIPTAPLPKMVATSPDGKYLAVTHWGDNTVAILDINHDNPFDFKYIGDLLEVDYRVRLTYSAGTQIDRDSNCGNCLRGTTFTPDSKYLLVSKMSGSGQISIFRTSDFQRVGKIVNMTSNLRHLITDNEYIYMSYNKGGLIEKIKWSEVTEKLIQDEDVIIDASILNKKQVNVGAGARTIVIDSESEYIYAAVNNSCQLVVVRNSDFQVVTSIATDPYPVGLAISPSNRMLIVTSQARQGIGGNCVMIFQVER